MKSVYCRLAGAVLGCACVLLALFVIPQQVARASVSGDYSVRSSTFNMLNRVQHYLGKEKYARAQALIDQYEPLVQHIPLERALLYQAKAYVLMAKSEYDAAIPALEDALDGGHLPADIASNLRYNLAQLYLNNARLHDGIKQLEVWFSSVSGPQPDAHALAGHAYYLLKRYDLADKHLNLAIGQSNSPPESWYDLLLATLYARQAYAEAERLLRKAIRRFPDKANYWMQLSYAALQTDNGKLALASAELAEDGDLLGSENLLYLAKLNMHLGLPHRAARVLQRAMQAQKIEVSPAHYKLLAEAWAQAREYDLAVSALDAAISARGADDGPRLQLRKAELLMQRERWSAAIQALDRARTVKDEALAARVELLLGICLYYTQDFAGSRRALESASRHTNLREIANSWLSQTHQHLDAGIR